MRKNYVGILYLIRGLPGSAKTTLAQLLAPESNYAADDLFTDDEDNYNFELSRLKEAHQACIANVSAAMVRADPVIAVHNTMSQGWESGAYENLAENWNYSIFVVECQNDFGNVHGVPEEVVQRMRERWEPLDGNLLPLWTIVRVRLKKRYSDLKQWLKSKRDLR
tara:strand:- start:830 stop:1324 length:495 start_codon:yes stop_codon:yes gene_type:complete